jgi:hypothetical protein
VSRSYQTNFASVRLSSDLPGLEIVLREFDKKLFDIMKEELALKEKSFGRKMAVEIQNIITKGGSKLSGYGWTYWERSKGQKNFKATTPAMSRRTFSTSTMYTSNTIRYPVHPATLFGSNGQKHYFTRKNMGFSGGKYALTDTGGMKNRFMVSAWGTSRSKSLFVRIYSPSSEKSDEIMQHEKGWTTSTGQRVVRPVIKPAWERLAPLVRNGVENSLRRVEKQMGSDFEKYKDKK